MLPPEHRLRRRQDFATATRRGRRAGRPLLVVHLRESEGVTAGGSAGAQDSAAETGLSSTDPHTAGEALSPARAGFVVSKAVGPAVVRNRVKRRLRHLVAARISGLPAGSLVVVRALPPAGTADYADLERDLDSALRKLTASRGNRPRGASTASSPTGAGQ
ncbi:ribonuclease P protein component [Streptacidiphilus sp. PB12-B1b]|uniref:ribonuclease P protein component n=1 Tax=Streptacidiphilus sp. PB12-B1b TaxID=2705012 RepID=UPI0015FABC03|nr:ribonuclease P protein component [Streptacidiphilus sp. PB12-B1b]QMU79897.1 ribonuclease P protein component [Streptacidiphilus sp. PB12-B1b]